MALNKNWKAISKVSMASESVQSMVFSGRFYDDADVAAPIGNGELVTKGILDTHQYNDTYFEYDLNVHKLAYPTAATDEVAIVDFSGRPFATNGELEYAVGYKLIGLAPKAGEVTRVRALQKGDKFRLADGNFTSAPTIGGYAAPTAGAGTWTPSAVVTTNATNIRIEGTFPLTVGARDEGTWYICTVVSVAQ